jgi:hypothetical protein
VDFVFAWQGGTSFEQFRPSSAAAAEQTPAACAANMTGPTAVIGIGWSMVVPRVPPFAERAEKQPGRA